VRGREQGGKRPVVILSGGTLNEYCDLVIVCSCSSRIKNFVGCPLLPKGKRTGLRLDSEALSFHIRSISQDRLIGKIGMVTTQELREILVGLGEYLRF